MKRILLSSTKKCPFGCKYCFARFSQYRPELTLEELERDRQKAIGVELLYPACDDDLFARKDAIAILKRTASFGCSISVSTKAELRDGVVAELKTLAEQMAASGLILKVGISFSTRAFILEIEPGTAKYEGRLKNIGMLSKNGITVSLNLKPLLQGQSSKEYVEILEDAAKWTDLLLLGDEYVDIHDASGLGTREVSWLEGHPQWPFRDDPPLLAEVKKCGADLGYNIFDSDLSLMVHAHGRSFRRVRYVV